MDKRFSFKPSPSRIGEVDEKVRFRASLLIKSSFFVSIKYCWSWMLTRFRCLRVFLWTVFKGCVESSRVFWVEYWKRYSSFEYFESSMESCTQALSILSRVWKVVLKLWVCWVEYGKSYSILDSSLSICPIPYSYSSRVWKVVLNLWVFWVEYGKLYSSFEYFESSMGSCTQALSILSRVWKVILDTRLIVEYLPDTVLILE